MHIQNKPIELTPLAHQGLLHPGMVPGDLYFQIHVPERFDRPPENTTLPHKNRACDRVQQYTPYTNGQPGIGPAPTQALLVDPLAYN